SRPDRPSPRPFGAAGPREAPAAGPDRRRRGARTPGSWLKPPDDPLQLARAALQGRLPILHEAVHRARSNRTVQRRHEVIAVDRLLDEVVGAAAEGLDRQRM